MNWSREQFPHPRYGITFGWQALSKALPCWWRIYRRPDHRYDLYLFALWDDYRNLAEPRDDTPFLLQKGLPSAPKAQGMAEAAERLLKKWAKSPGQATEVSQSGPTSPPSP